MVSLFSLVVRLTSGESICEYGFIGLGFALQDKAAMNYALVVLVLLSILVSRTLGNPNPAAIVVSSLVRNIGIFLATILALIVYAVRAMLWLTAQSFTTVGG